MSETSARTRQSPGPLVLSQPRFEGFRPVKPKVQVIAGQVVEVEAARLEITFSVELASVRQDLETVAALYQKDVTTVIVDYPDQLYLEGMRPVEVPRPEVIHATT